MLKKISCSIIYYTFIKYHAKLGFVLVEAKMILNDAVLVDNINVLI